MHHHEISEFQGELPGRMKQKTGLQEKKEITVSGKKIRPHTRAQESEFHQTSQQCDGNLCMLTVNWVKWSPD